MKRRDFINHSTFGALGLSLSTNIIMLSGCTNDTKQPDGDFEILITDLLKTWCDGMLQHLVDKPEDTSVHGALWCPACNKIHGRLMDAVYPFMYMARRTGEEKYLTAAIAVMDWSENVSMPDGSWTVIPDPKSWKGITVFGAIALGEALHYHGDLLPPDIREKWLSRAEKAAEYIYKNFDLTFTNINYGGTAIYALNLLGNLLGKPHYKKRSKELASGISDFFTEPNHLLYGEGKPSTKKSPKGLLPVDLGYNVEETLNGLVMYALHENDEALLSLLSKSLESHLAFMLPDGAWDNSWGTRQAKWSYWGSRTTDGSQLAFGMTAHLNPAFGTAAYLNTELLKRCTHEGLLHGGPHYVSHGVKPCIHHTFAHAKPLAALLDSETNLSLITKEKRIPRQINQGVKEFPEVDVWLTSKGTWRSTISSYDFVYKKYAQQVTGGSLGVLWHEKVGTIMAGSMAKYMLVEKNNQQPDPDDEDIALTPRIECFHEGKWFTNIYDLEAKVKYQESETRQVFNIETRLVDEDRTALEDHMSAYKLIYAFTNDEFKIQVEHSLQTTQAERAHHNLAIPIISPTGEKVIQVNANLVTITKPGGTVNIESNAPISIRKTKKERTFNMVPGMEAIVIDIPLPEGVNNVTPVECTVTVN